jgi:hypothetical protein
MRASSPASGQLANFPSTDGRRIAVDITSTGQSVTLSVSGASSCGEVLFELPDFVDNIRSATSGTIDRRSGTVTVTLSAHQRRVTVPLVRAVT